ncbi:hypothetical protein NECID01_2080 [Nematocida sp. AWRm77]|nr:hypothetical protein NECID01_2080 [Nematocida sp. AWRm77]
MDKRSIIDTGTEDSPLVKLQMGENTTATHEFKKFSTVACIESKVKEIFSEGSSGMPCFILLCGGKQLFHHTQLEHLLEHRVDNVIQIDILVCTGAHPHSITDNSTDKEAAEKINMQCETDKKETREEEKLPEKEEAPQSSTENKQTERALVKVKDANGKVHYVRKSQLATLNGKTYFLRKKKTHKLNLLSLLPKYSTILTYFFVGMVFSFYLNKIFIVIAVALFLLNYVEHLKVKIQFRKNESLKNFTKHCMCFFISVFLNPGYNLITYTD